MNRIIAFFVIRSAILPPGSMPGRSGACTTRGQQCVDIVKRYDLRAVVDPAFAAAINQTAAIGRHADQFCEMFQPL